MPAETKRQAYAARMAYAYKHGKLEDSEVNDSIKQMAKMNDKELKKFMTLKEEEEEENILNEIKRKCDYLNQELLNNSHSELADYLDSYFKKAQHEYRHLLKAYDIEESNDLNSFLEQELIDFNNNLNDFLAKYEIEIPKIFLDKDARKDKILLMDKKSSRTYIEIFDIIKRFYPSDPNVHFSLSGNTIHFEKHKPKIGEWDEEQQLKLATKQWEKGGLIQTWAQPKAEDRFYLSILNSKVDTIGIKLDVLIILEDYLEEDNSTADIAVFSGSFKKDAIIKREPQLEREGKTLKESEGGAFAYFYKVGEQWWKKWVKDNAAQYDIIYDKQDRLYLVYEGNSHILTYNTKTGEVFTDKQLQELTTQQSDLVEKIEKLAGRKIVLL